MNSNNRNNNNNNQIKKQNHIRHAPKSNISSNQRINSLRINTRIDDSSEKENYFNSIVHLDEEKEDEKYSKEKENYSKFLSYRNSVDNSSISAKNKSNNSKNINISSFYLSVNQNENKKNFKKLKFSNNNNINKNSEPISESNNESNSNSNKDESDISGNLLSNKSNRHQKNENINSSNHHKKNISNFLNNVKSIAYEDEFSSSKKINFFSKADEELFSNYRNFFMKNEEKINYWKNNHLHLLQRNEPYIKLKLINSNVNLKQIQNVFYIGKNGLDCSMKNAFRDITSIGRQQVTDDFIRPNDIMLYPTDSSISRSHFKIAHKVIFEQFENTQIKIDLINRLIHSKHSKYSFSFEIWYMIMLFLKPKATTTVIDNSTIYGTYLRIKPIDNKTLLINLFIALSSFLDNKKNEKPVSHNPFCQFVNSNYNFNSNICQNISNNNYYSNQTITKNTNKMNIFNDKDLIFDNNNNKSKDNIFFKNFIEQENEKINSANLIFKNDYIISNFDISKRNIYNPNFESTQILKKILRENSSNQIFPDINKIDVKSALAFLSFYLSKMDIESLRCSLHNYLQNNYSDIFLSPIKCDNVELYTLFNMNNSILKNDQMYLTSSHSGFVVNLISSLGKILRKILNMRTELSINPLYEISIISINQIFNEQSLELSSHLFTYTTKNFDLLRLAFKKEIFRSYTAVHLIETEGDPCGIMNKIRSLIIVADSPFVNNNNNNFNSNAGNNILLQLFNEEITDLNNNDDYHTNFQEKNDETSIDSFTFGLQKGFLLGQNSKRCIYDSLMQCDIFVWYSAVAKNWAIANLSNMNIEQFQRINENSIDVDSTDLYEEEFTGLWLCVAPDKKHENRFPAFSEGISAKNHDQIRISESVFELEYHVGKMNLMDQSVNDVNNDIEMEDIQ